MKNSKIEALDVSDLPKFLFRKVHPKLAYSFSLPVFPRLCQVEAHCSSEHIYLGILWRFCAKPTPSSNKVTDMSVYLTTYVCKMFR